MKLPCFPSAGFVPQPVALRVSLKDVDSWNGKQEPGTGHSYSLSPVFACSFQLYYLFFPWDFQGCCSCLAGNFCSLATSCHCSTAHTPDGEGGGVTPFFVPARRSRHGGSFLAQVRVVRKFFKAPIFASNSRLQLHFWKARASCA